MVCILMSHIIGHAMVYTITPLKAPNYRVILVETKPVVANTSIIPLFNIISKIFRAPLIANVKLKIKGKPIKKIERAKLAYIVSLLSTITIPIYIMEFEQNSQVLISYIEMNNDEPSVISTALVTKKNLKRILDRETHFVIILRGLSKELTSEFISHMYKYSWKLLNSLANLQLDINDKAESPRKRYTIAVLLEGKSEEDTIEINVPEMHDTIKIRVPIREPLWRLEDIPPKLRYDIETIILRPIISKAPYAPKGILIIGPPGVGKSVTAETIARGLGLKLVEIRPSTYRSMWYGLTEKILEHLLKGLKNRKNIAILMDDVDFLVGRQISIHETHISEITIFLRYLQEPSRPLLIMTTNTPELLDPALMRPGRIDVIVIMGYPDKEFRRHIALKSAERYRIKLDENILNSIERMTRWFTNAEIDALIRLAASKGDGIITEDALQWARQRFNINEQMRKNIQDQLRWFAEQIQGITIRYIPNDNEII